MRREQGWLRPRALYGYFPAGRTATSWSCFDPGEPDREMGRFAFPRQPRHERLCLADYFRPLGDGEPRRVALQAVTAGAEATRADRASGGRGRLRRELFLHGLGVQTAEGVAEWLHARVRRELGIDARSGPALLVGLPRLPRA